MLACRMWLWITKNDTENPHKIFTPETNGKYEMHELEEINSATIIWELATPERKETRLKITVASGSWNKIKRSPPS